MKEEYKVYLVFWSPLTFLVLACILLFLSYYKKTAFPFSSTKLPQEHLQIINELNSLYSLDTTQLQERVGEDFFVLSAKHFTKPVLSSPSEVFHLKMIYIEGNQKACIINDKRFKEGDWLKKDIKVFKIGDYYVELQIKKQIKKLFLGEVITI